MSGNISQEMTDWIVKAKELLDASIGQGAKPTAGAFRQKMLDGIQIATKPKPAEITPGDWTALQQSSAKIQQKLNSNSQIKKAIQQITQKPDTTSIPQPVWDAVFSFWEEFDSLSKDIEKRRLAMAQVVVDHGDPALFLEPKALEQLKQLDDPNAIYGKVKALEKQNRDLNVKLDARQSAAYLIDVAATKQELAAVTQSLKRLELGDAKDRLDTVGKTIDDVCHEIDAVNTFMTDNGGVGAVPALAKQLGVADTKDRGAVFKALKLLKDAKADQAQLANDLKLAVTQAKAAYTNPKNKDTQGKEQKKTQSLQLEKNCGDWLADWSKLKIPEQVGPAGKDLLGKVRDRIAVLNQGAPKSAIQIGAEQAAQAAQQAQQAWTAFRAAIETAVNAYVGASYDPALRGAFPGNPLTQSVVTRCQDVPQFSVGGRPFFWSPSQTTPQAGAMHWEIPNNFWTTGANGQLIRSFIYHLAPQP